MRTPLYSVGSHTANSSLQVCRSLHDIIFNFTVKIIFHYAVLINRFISGFIENLKKSNRILNRLDDFFLFCVLAAMVKMQAKLKVA